MRSYVNLAGSGLHLMFTLAVADRGFVSSSWFYLFSSPFLGLPLKVFINRLSYSFFSYNLLLLYWDPIDMVVKCWGASGFYIL